MRSGEAGRLAVIGTERRIDRAHDAAWNKFDFCRSAKASLGEAAATDARDRFSIEQHVAQLAALYRQGLAERSRRPVLQGARG